MILRLKGNLPDGLLPIASDEGGNQFFISMRSEQAGQLGFWDHETGNMRFIEGGIRGFYCGLNEKTEFSGMEEIFEKDDVGRLVECIRDIGVNSRNLDGNTPLEEAAIYGGLRCIEKLHELGALPYNSIMIAEKNAVYFDEHKQVVNLLNELYPSGTSI